MPNTSASGGYLLPASIPAPLEGQALLRFFQQIVVGVTNLDGTLVRPYWQTEPPDIPDEGEAWAAFKITRRPADEYPFVGRIPSQPEDGADHLQRHEELDILATFYDTGSTGLDNSGGLADYYASVLRDGLAVPQNRETLFLVGMGIAKIGTVVTVPIIFKKRWQNRVDFDFSVRRQIDRTYPVQTIKSAFGFIYTDTGLPPQPFGISSLPLDIVPPPPTQNGVVIVSAVGSGSYLVKASDGAIFVKATPFTIELPVPPGFTHSVSIKNATSVDGVTVQPQSGTIDGDLSKLLTAYNSINVQWSGDEWSVL